MITGTKMQNVGIRMSWFFILSSIGRIIGPIFGFYVIEYQEGNISFLAHLSSFYLLVISFVAMVAMMETNKRGVVYETIERKQEPQIVLHSQRKKHYRIPSKSVSVTPYSRDKSNEKAEEESEKNEEGVDGVMKDRKRHFNYSPVDRTESAESIKVSYKPKQTFVEKWSCNDDEVDEDEVDEDEVDRSEKESEGNILSKLKKKSSRFLRLNHKQKKSQTHSYTNVQNPNIGLNDLQL